MMLSQYLDNFRFDEDNNIIDCIDVDRAYHGRTDRTGKIFALNLSEYLGYEHDALTISYDIDSLLYTSPNIPRVNGSLSFFLFGNHHKKLARHNHLYHQVSVGLNRSIKVKLFRVPHTQLFQI